MSIAVASQLGTFDLTLFHFVCTLPVKAVLQPIMAEFTIPDEDLASLKGKVVIVTGKQKE